MTRGAHRRQGELLFSPLLPVEPSPLPNGARQPGGWRLESLRGRNLEPAAVVAGGRVLNGYQYRTREGRFYLEPWDIVARLTSDRGQVIVLPAQGLFHIQEAHFGDRARNRFTRAMSVGLLLAEVARRLPGEVVYAQREARLEFCLDRAVGDDGVASYDELVERGVVQGEELQALAGLRHEVLRLNLVGSDGEKRAFRARANRGLAGSSIQFILRRGALVQQYSVAPRQTRWLAMTIHRDSQRPRERAASGRGEIRTLYPGRVRPPLPAGSWFFRHYGADRPSRGLAILEKLIREQPLEKGYERAAVREQRRAQEFWWTHGFTTVGRRGES